MPPLVDPLGRPVTYLRISVTDRCNLRCGYCMPREGVNPIPHADVLRYEEILAVVRAARSLGFDRFRVTGGEPLARRGVLWLLERLASEGAPVSITTNGILLARFARDIAGAGLRRINVGLDTLRGDRFHRITGTDGLAIVLRGIDAARAEGIAPLKVNVVVMRGVNDDEVVDFIDWGRRERLDVRFIEFMPVRGEDLFVSLAPFIASVERSGGLHPAAIEGGGPARSFRYLDGAGTVGFIMPRTEPFCAGCNRVRLTADGTLLPCLFSQEGIPLRDALRSGGDIAALIRDAVRAKPEGHGLKMRLHRYGMHALGG
ncbi:MAG: GTP 3',8-cyclase MoaA [Chlamydiota bacterium]